MHTRRWLAVTLLAICVPMASAAEPAVFTPLTEEQAAAKRSTIEKIAVDPAGERPNIVLLFADDLGYAELGCYGSKHIPTPHIDNLASDGIKFTNAYVTAGTCSPSRAGLLSGRYQHRFGFEFNTGSARITRRLGRGLDPSAITLADVLQHAGYATGMVGKWHLGNRTQYHPHERGFDEFFGFLAGAHHFVDPSTLSPQAKAIQVGGGSSGAILRGTEPVNEDEYLTDAFAREAVAFIERHKADPFFLYVPFNAVHTPIQATDKYLARFADVDDLKRRTFYAMTSAMDDAVGQVLQALKANNLVDNTLVIFFDDNGGPLYTGVQSNHPLRFGKLFLFEGGIRVPLLMRWPGVIEASQVSDQLVSALDFFPTLSRLAGADVPESLALDGVDLSGWLQGTTDEVPSAPLFWRNGTNKAMRNSKWKLIEVPDHVWLFDLAADVGERHNLAEQYPDVVREMQREYKQWEAGLKSPAWPAREGRLQQMIDGVTYEIQI